MSAKDMPRVVLKTVLVVATLAALYLLFALRHLVLTVFAAVIFASALRPVVSWMQRRLALSQSAATLALYGSIAAATLVGVAALAPAVIDDTLALLRRSAEVYGRWHEFAIAVRTSAHARLGLSLPMPPPQPEVKARIAAAAADLQRMLPVYALRTGGVLADVLFGLVVAYYWLEARNEILASGPQVLPEEQRPRFLAVCDDIERVLGGYLGGQLILSLLITLASLLAFVAIGLPDPVVLALIGGLLHVVPLIGATIGVIPPILVAVSISPGKGLATAATLLLIHQIENSFVAPRVLQRQVGLSPLLVLIALAAGATLGGVAGALIAVPAAGTLWILARHLLIEPAARRQEAQLGVGGPATSAPAEPDLEQG